MFVRVTRPQMLRRLTKQMETFPVGGFLYSQTNLFGVDVTRSSCYFMLFVLGAVGFYHNNTNLLNTLQFNGLSWRSCVLS